MASLRPRQGQRGTTYRVMWRTPDGRQRSKSVKGLADARRLVSEMGLAERAGAAPNPAKGNITLAYWAEQVLATKALKPKTRATYEDLLRSRILPTFGSMPLRSIERSSIRTWAFRLAEDVSARRAQNAYALLRHLLDEAVAEEHLGRNPALRIRLPQAEHPEVVPWTLDELMAVADAAGRYRGLITWLGLMGTRWAETVGLRPSDIDGDRVNISSSLSEVRGAFHRVPTKTYQSRTLPIPRGVLEVMPECSGGLVFTSPRGFPLRSAQFRDRYFLPACQAAGVRPIRIHHLRHTAASLLAQQGASPATVQRWLGHQDIRMTMNTYTHAFDTDLRIETERLDGRLRGRTDAVRAGLDRAGFVAPPL